MVSTVGFATSWSKQLTCPIVRMAQVDDIPSIVETILNSDSLFIKNIFRDKLDKARDALIETYTNNYAGLYVITEGPMVIGVTRLQLPTQPLYKAISFQTLIKHLGWRRGLRAGFLMSPWDEYRSKRNEAYIEFLYIRSEWKNSDAGRILLNKAVDLAIATKSKFISIFVPHLDQKMTDLLERRGFFRHRNVKSPFASIFSDVYQWEKWVCPTVDRPITIKGLLINRVERARRVWNRRRQQAITSFRFSVALVMLPLIYGTLAYYRGFTLATLGWVLVLVSHSIGLFSIYFKRLSGAVLLFSAVIVESINLILRAVFTETWSYRLWLLPLAFLNFWMVWVLYRAKKMNYLAQQEIPIPQNM